MLILLFSGIMTSRRITVMAPVETSWLIRMDTYGCNAMHPVTGVVAPRPFMVERGHRDGVSVDDCVLYEYAHVRRLYDDLGIGDRTEIDVFDGAHEINAKGTFDFLHKHLRFGAPAP